jgi:NAD-dependent SIR2 family protein deacetylase
MNWWNKEVKRPDLWQIPKTCAKCGWKNQPEEPFKRINVLFQIKKCPKCSGRLAAVRINNCLACGEIFPLMRIPKNFQQAMRGGYSCNKCGSEFNKWGCKISV